MGSILLWSGGWSGRKTGANEWPQMVALGRTVAEPWLNRSFYPESALSGPILALDVCQGEYTLPNTSNPKPKRMGKLLTVFGATGQQGGNLIDYVLRHPELSTIYRIRGVTRDVTKPAALALREKGVDVVSVTSPYG